MDPWFCMQFTHLNKLHIGCKKFPKKSLQLMWLKAKMKIMTLKRCWKILKLGLILPHQTRNLRRANPRKRRTKRPTKYLTKLLILNLQIIWIALSVSVQGNRLLWLNLADMPPFARAVPNGFQMRNHLDAQYAKLLSLGPKESFNKLVHLPISHDDE